MGDIRGDDPSGGLRHPALYADDEADLNAGKRIAGAFYDTGGRAQAVENAQEAYYQGAHGIG